ncbi:MAG: hypothetical protein AAF696_09315, partial [Bacteroidota bacterium]
LAVLMSLSKYQRLLSKSHYFLEIAWEYLISGLNLYMTQGYHQNTFQEEILGSEIDSVFLQKENWGLYDLIHIRAIHGPAQVSTSCFAGQAPKEDFSLYLTDKRQPLVLTAKAKLKGKLFLPPSGIRSGHIGPISYQYSQLYEGTISHSSTESKKISLSSRPTIKSKLEKLEIERSPLETYLMEGEARTVSWRNPAFSYQLPHNLILENCQFHGKILLISSGKIRIKATNQIQHAILIAKEIEIDKGFSGSLQAFATESIRLEEGVTLSYPSLVYLAKKETPAYLEIQKNSRLEGALIYETQSFHSAIHREDFVYVSNGSEIYGIVHAQHNLDLQGKVKGQVITDNFLLRTPASLYRNHIMDGEIFFEELDKTYVAPRIYAASAIQIMTWL